MAFDGSKPLPSDLKVHLLNYAEFQVPARGCKASGPVVDTALYVTYHYEIRRVDSGQVAADPDINVKH